MPPTTTMKRIAGELGVSITTVSKVLNNRDDIGHATRARVLAKVAELGYQPNAVARSLTLRRTHTLGVVIPDLMHSFFVEIIAGIEPVASARGYGLLLCSSSEDPRQGARRSSRCSGSARWTASSSASANAVGQHRPAAAADVARHRAGHDRPRRSSRRPVRPRRHRRRGGRAAGDGASASSRGGSAIAHIAGPPIVHAKRRDRRLSRRAAGARRSSAMPNWIVRGGFMEADGYRAMKKLLAVKPRDRRGVRRERSVRDRRDEGDLGSGAARAGRHRRRRRRRHRARRSAARAADDGQLVARGPGEGARRSCCSSASMAIREPPAGPRARRHPAAAGRAALERRAR